MIVRGTYLRHFLAVIIGAIVTSIFDWAHNRFGLNFEAAEVQAFIDHLTTGAEFAVFGLVYAFGEKFLKRFRKIDPEAAAEFEAKRAS